jgi:hypothetical protein
MQGRPILPWRRLPRHAAIADGGLTSTVPVDAHSPPAKRQARVGAEFPYTKHHPARALELRAFMSAAANPRQVGRRNSLRKSRDRSTVIRMTRIEIDSLIDWHAGAARWKPAGARREPADRSFCIVQRVARVCRALHTCAR